MTSTTPENDRFLRFGAFIGPFHDPAANPSVHLRRGLELATHLDELGFDEIFYGEHHSGGVEILPAPDLYIAAAAEHTERIVFGTGVVSLPYHHPLMTADRICQLDHMTRGRLIFGTGPGKLPLDAYMLGIDTTKQREMQREALEAITALLRGEIVTMHTDWFTLQEGVLQLLPYKAEGIEIAAASSVSTAGSVAAGRFGLSLLSMAAGDPAGFEALDRNWEVYEYEAHRHGHVTKRDRWRLVSPMFIAESEQAAKKAVSRRLQFLLDYIVRIFGNAEFPWSRSTDAMIEQWTTEGLPGFGVAVIGTPDQAIDHIERLWAKTGGFGAHLNWFFDVAEWEDTKRSWELTALEVMPYFQRSARSRQTSAEHQGRYATQLNEIMAGAVTAESERYFQEREAGGTRKGSAR